MGKVDRTHPGRGGVWTVNIELCFFLWIGFPKLRNFFIKLHNTFVTTVNGSGNLNSPYQLQIVIGMPLVGNDR
jgi:hypothetical protein